MGAVWGPEYLCLRTTLGQLLPAVSPASSYYCMRTKDSRDSVQVKHAGHRWTGQVGKQLLGWILNVET